MTDRQKQLATDFAELCEASIEICNDLGTPAPIWLADWFARYNEWNGRRQEAQAAAQREADDRLQRVCAENQARLRADSEFPAKLREPKEDPRLQYWARNNIA
jgi:hypothetical protein